jgi:peptidoglycan/xylan/chitin deacetylase (PgdA/CDA1 family)
MESTNTLKKTYFAVTVDVDPDVNLPVPGQVHAVSQPIDKGEARFESSARGLQAIVKMLNDIKLPGTFFIEARTAERLEADFDLNLRKLLSNHEVGSHAYMHEDFLGKDTGNPLTKDEMIDTMKTSLEILAGITGRQVSGFRAPYVRINDTLAEALVGMGLEYDSSVTRDWKLDEGQAGKFQPYFYFEESGIKIDIPQALIEVPLPNFVMPGGTKMSSYLWPVLEGDLTFEKYNEVLFQVAAQPPTDSLVLLATHPWHMVETYAHGVLPEQEHKSVMIQYEKQLLDLKTKKNVEFCTISEYLEKWHSDAQLRELEHVMGKV